jgi:methylisocitrate lyase
MNKFKELLASGRLLLAAGCQDALSARFAERYGFDVALLGGYDLGAALCITEPLITETETVLEARYITRAVSIPLLVDIGAGYGEPMHVVRTIEDLKQVGVAAVQLEDQIYPKRAHYYADYTEHLLPLEEMLEKLHWAKEAAGDDVFILGRTDAFKTDGADEAIRRARAFFEAGVDAVTAFPNTLEEAEAFPKSVDGPVFYGNTHGNRIGRPMLTPDQAEAFGYAMHWDCHGLLFSAFAAMEQAAESFTKEHGWQFGFDTIALRQRCDEMAGVPRLLAIERETVERS